ncbi:hypothetical protein ACI2OX_11820 [Bacillus sp. N9]
MAHSDPTAEVLGLDQFPEDEIPHFTSIIYLILCLRLACGWSYYHLFFDWNETPLAIYTIELVPLAYRSWWTSLLLRSKRDGG